MSEKERTYIHFFSDSTEAYDATQTEQHWDGSQYVSVKSGDILVIKSEQIVGVSSVWPIAVTIKHGQLHTPADGYTAESAISDVVDVPEGKTIEELCAEAREIAEEKGWPLQEVNK